MVFVRPSINKLLPNSLRQNSHVSLTPQQIYIRVYICNHLSFEALVHKIHE